MFIAPLFIMYVRANMSDCSLAQQLDPQFLERSLEGLPCEHLGSGFQRERNNNPFYDAFHMRSMTLTDFFFFLDCFVLH